MRTNLDNLYNEIDNEFKTKGNFNDYIQDIETSIKNLNARITGYNNEIISRSANINKMVEKVHEQSSEDKKNQIMQKVIDERKKVSELKKQKTDLEKIKDRIETVFERTNDYERIKEK